MDEEILAEECQMYTRQEWTHSEYIIRETERRLDDEVRRADDEETTTAIAGLRDETAGNDEHCAAEAVGLSLALTRSTSRLEVVRN